MDEATRRRSVESVNAAGATSWRSWPATSCSRGAAESRRRDSATRSCRIARGDLARLCQGKWAEVRAAFQIERDEDDYLRCISNKTAALMSTACASVH